MFKAGTWIGVVSGVVSVPAVRNGVKFQQRCKLVLVELNVKCRRKRKVKTIV